MKKASTWLAMAVLVAVVIGFAASAGLRLREEHLPQSAQEIAERARRCRVMLWRGDSFVGPETGKAMGEPLHVLIDRNERSMNRLGSK